jgi:uncharacterized membrane-anchored protein
MVKGTIESVLSQTFEEGWVIEIQYDASGHKKDSQRGPAADF